MALVKINIRIEEEVLEIIKERAKAEGISAYSYASDVFQRAVIYQQKEKADEYLAPHIRKVVQQELERFYESIQEMLVRSYMEAGTARRMSMASLTLNNNLSREATEKLATQNWESTYKELRRDIAHVGNWRELVATEIERRESTLQKAAKSEAPEIEVSSNEQAESTEL